MSDNWLQRWNDRYQEKEFAYGTEPNEFLKEQLQSLEPKTILFGAEGEGRNAVFAAKLGWNVSAFDISTEGRNKALTLATQYKVTINYQVGLLPELQFNDEPFDAIALIYAHFPPAIKTEYHTLLSNKLKKGGLVILEAFSKNNLTYRNENPGVGGPANLESLFSIDELKSDFSNFEPLLLEEKVIELHEGLYHNGTGSVVRFVGRKQ